MVYMDIDTELLENHARCGTTGPRKIQKEHETKVGQRLKIFRSKTAQARVRPPKKMSLQETVRKERDGNGYQPRVSSPSSFQMLNMLFKLVVDLRVKDERSLGPRCGIFASLTPFNFPASASSLL